MRPLDAVLLIHDTLDNPTRLLLAVVFALAALGVGCGHDRPAHRWNDRVLAVGDLQDAGKLDRAEQQYQQLLKTAPTRDARRYVLSALARISEARADWKQAIARYKRISSKPIDDEAGAYALYRAGRLAKEKLGQTARGLAAFKKTITRFPRSVAAEFAVRDLAKYYRQTGDYEAMRRDFEKLVARVGDQPAADNLLFELAEALSDAGDKDTALLYFKRVYDGYSDGGLADDALWDASQIYAAREQWPQTIALLQRVAAMVEDSWFVGDYSSPYANDARFQLGLIYLLYVSDYDKAIANFEQYLDDFPTSLQADDAAWNLVQAHRLKGPAAAYQQSLRDFMANYPHSRYVRQAKRRLAGRAAQ